ncbi:MAG TPA: bifunctional DNA primase/polymerase [Actinoplanes sp.]|nr:bifunctional DNA primase/polymerase [Actinoplanes sp.]
MRWQNRQTFGAAGLLDRARLRRAALRYVAHGWSVTPGACLVGNRFVCGRPGCPIMGCHPALDDWETTVSTDAARVAAWWRRRPHAVLLATGEQLDALDVPAALGLRTIGMIEGPVAVTATGRWMFLVRPGTPLRQELQNRLDVVRHSHGSWIPAAPSRMIEGPVRWAVSPEQAHWDLPAAAHVQQALVDALQTLGRHTQTAVGVPRQVSTTRRAA